MRKSFYRRAGLALLWAVTAVAANPSPAAVRETARHDYDEAGTLAKLTHPDGTFLAHGCGTAQRLTPIADSLGNSVTCMLDEFGNRTQVTRPKGNGQSFEYDAASRLTRVSNSLEPGKFSELAYDLHGNLASRKDANGHVTGHQYDARHRRWKTAFADTTSETRTFDGAGNVRTLTDANGVVTTFTYDERSRERLKAYSASADGLVSVGTHLYGYDSLNRRTTVTTAGEAITTGYDRTHLPVEVRYPNGVVSTTVYDAAMRVRLVEHTKGAQCLEKTEHTYDRNGNRRTQTRTAGGVTETTTYLYDDDDGLNSMRARAQ